MNPQLSTKAAHALSFLFAFCYVGSLYISKNSRLSFVKKPLPRSDRLYGKREREENERWRNDPEVIQVRLIAAVISTIVCCGIVLSIECYYAGNGVHAVLQATLKRLGLIPAFTISELFPHLVIPILFLGPIYTRYLGAYLPFQKNWSYQTCVTHRVFSWQGIRNYVVGPITEEIVFRACVLSVYRMSDMSRMRMIFFSPFSFGLAHIHHAWEIYNRHGRTALAAKTAVAMSAFQFLYTSIFGFLCSQLFLRTGLVYPAISAHIFCNFMGLPELSWELHAYPQHRKAILCVYGLGMVLFIFGLIPLTNSDSPSYWSR